MKVETTLPLEKEARILQLCDIATGSDDTLQNAWITIFMPGKTADNISAAISVSDDRKK